MRFKYYPRNEYDHGAILRFPQWINNRNRWTIVARIPYAGLLFIHTPLEVR